MQRALAGLSLLWPVLAFGQAAPSPFTVYGRLSVAAERASASGQPGLSRLAAHRSVFGFRGSEELGGGLRALWQIEGAVALDMGQGGLANRDTRVALQGPWGTLSFGHWLTPYAASASAFDPLFPTTVGLGNLIGNGTAPSTDNTGNLSAFDRRQANSIGYQSPPLAGWTLGVAATPKEESGRRPGFDPWLASAALSYDGAAGPLPLQAVLAVEAHHDYQIPGGRDGGLKLGLRSQWRGLRGAIVAERLRYETAAGRLQRDALFLSASGTVGPGLLSLNLARARAARGPADQRVGFVRGGPDSGATQWTLGYELALSKRTALFGFASRLDNGSRGAYDFVLNPTGLPVGGTARVLGLGVRHHL